MTCIAGIVHKGSIWMGADSAGADDKSSLIVRADKKVFTNGPFLMGFTSSFRMGQLLAHAFCPPNPPKHDDPDLMKFMVVDFINSVRECLKAGGLAERKDEVESAGTFLVGYGSRLFKVESDYQVGESVHGFDACGCGEDLALGSLFSTKTMTNPKKRLGLALTAAESFSAGVRSPFHILELSP